MENRSYWNPFDSLWTHPLQTMISRPAPWKEIEKQECQKIWSMSTPQFFNYVEQIVTDRRPIVPLQDDFRFFQRNTQIFCQPGKIAADEYAWTLASILYNLEKRLKGTAFLLYFGNPRVPC